MPDIEKNGWGIPVQVIQGGCKLIDGASNSWLYEFEDRNGPQRYVFIAAFDEFPQIGDTIENGMLVKKDHPLINNDPGVVQGHNYRDGTWPENFKG